MDVRRSSSGTKIKILRSAGIPAKGKITVDGIEVNQENLSRIRQCLGYVLQDSDNQMFMPTVYEDMIFGALNYGIERPPEL